MPWNDWITYLTRILCLRLCPLPNNHPWLNNSKGCFDPPRGICPQLGLPPPFRPSVMAQKAVWWWRLWKKGWRIGRPLSRINCCCSFCHRGNTLYLPTFTALPSNINYVPRFSIFSRMLSFTCQFNQPTDDQDTHIAFCRSPASIVCLLVVSLWIISPRFRTATMFIIMAYGAFCSFRVLIHHIRGMDEAKKKISMKSMKDHFYRFFMSHRFNRLVHSVTLLVALNKHKIFPTKVYLLEGVAEVDFPGTKKTECY